jgi:archaellum component FlaF (FlaF/FlaG flagellin family)
MKRFIISIFAIFCVANLFAQEVTPEQSGPVQMNLSSFDAIDVNAPIKLKLIKIDKSETPYIIYDTKGVYTSKFTVEVEKKQNGILKIEERSDPKRESTTEVTVYFNELTDISISKADVSVDGTLKSNLLDLYLSNGTHFTADIDALDTKVSVSGKCGIVLTGYSRYQTVDVATAEYNAAKLETLSTVASSSHNAIVKINATERLEAKTSTGGKILYYTEPVILRTEITLFGGEIKLL